MDREMIYMLASYVESGFLTAGEAKKGAETYLARACLAREGEDTKISAISIAAQLIALGAHHIGLGRDKIMVLLTKLSDDGVL